MPESGVIRSALELVASGCNESSTESKATECNTKSKEASLNASEAISSGSKQLCPTSGVFYFTLLPLLITGCLKTEALK